jgi:hypothetical protein
MAFDKAVIQEVSQFDFTAENFLRLAKRIERRQKWPRPFDADHFFPACRGMMIQNLLKVWGCGDAAIGGLFVKNLYAGTLDGIVLFWWSLDGEKSEKLWGLFEREARKCGCDRIATSTFGDVRAEALGRLYRRKGFEESERVYTKFLEY